MFQIDTRSRIPIYEQLRDLILNYIGAGILKPDEQLPSIRSIAAESSINVNTVKKAFEELQNDGIIYSVPGKGCFVSCEITENNAAHQKALAGLEPVIISAKNRGVKAEEIVMLITKIYKEDK